MPTPAMSPSAEYLLIGLRQTMARAYWPLCISEEMDMSKITVLNDTDLDAVTGAAYWSYNYNTVVTYNNTAISGTATGDIYFSGVSIKNKWTGDANAGNVSIG